MAMASNPDAILIELGTLLRRICAHEMPDLTPDTPLDEIPGIDSLRLLQAIAHLEEHFNVEIDVAALDDLVRVQDIVTAVTEARQADDPERTSV
jgi:acyl carrier protein